VTPFSPATLVSLSAALSSAKIVHTLFSTQLDDSTSTFYALLQGGLDAVAFAVKKIIEEIAKRFNDMYPLYVLTSSHGNNSSSIAAVEQHTAPPQENTRPGKDTNMKRGILKYTGGSPK
jgi:hypothetical protein